MLTLIGCFFFGVFAINAIPHIISGLLGQKITTPFASPMFSQSSAVLNIIWGTINIVLAVYIYTYLPPLNNLLSDTVITVIAGAFFTAIGLAWHFGRLYANR